MRPAAPPRSSRAAAPSHPFSAGNSEFPGEKLSKSEYKRRIKAAEKEKEAAAKAEAKARRRRRRCAATQHPSLTFSAGGQGGC